MAGDPIGGGGGGSAAGKGPRSSTRHQQFHDRAKTHVDDLQEIFFGLQSARKESRSADAAVLEEQEDESRRDENLKYNCKCSFLEIYNEQITDLLDPSSTNLQGLEDISNAS
ncbi:hypothetical protein ZWY2020_024092 [Hordeum vulgare]|nr:hypothetical protein ZWY2020_024092 [Hordeum vulgare]